MALVSGGRSILNPKALLFIPAAMRQVEDFSPEWWDLVTTSTWFRDYWLSQHRGEDILVEEIDGFDGYDVVELLPDSIDLGVDEDILNMEAQFEEFLQSSKADHGSKGVMGRMAENGFDKALVKNLSLPNERREPAKYWDKPVKHVSPKCSPRSIQQPR